MISVVIPSLMRIERIHQTISELSKHDEIGEIILLDNSGNTVPMEIPKLIHVCEGKNTYINPAWNKGAAMAKYDKLCFLNDDIWFNWKYLNVITDFILPSVGLIGMDPDNYTQDPGFFSISPISAGRLRRGHRPTGFACCFFVHRDNWDPIPEDMKLWAGDDWLFYRSKFSNCVIKGLKCEGFVSGTLDDEALASELNPIKVEDMHAMVEHVKKGEIENYLLGTIWWK